MKRLLLVLVLAFVPALASAQSPSPYTALPTQPLAPAIVVFPGSANQVLAVDGSVTAPSMSFASEPGLGFYRVGSQDIGLAAAGGKYYDFTTSTFSLSSVITIGWNGDAFLSRTSAGAVKVANTAAATAELQVSGGNGGFLSSVKALTELTTIAAAATTSTAIQIPANAVVLAVSVRVVTVIPTAATFTVTSATPAKTWSTAAVAVAANTTDPGTAPGPSFQTTASAIVITPNLTPATATGQVRVTIYYYQVTPPTS